ncbi:MAG: FliH/SctL family protein [Chlamydiota bacterium]
MKYFSLFSHQSVRSTESKILPKEEVECLLAGEELVRTAKTEALAYRTEVASECELLKEEAEKAGFLAGLKKLYEHHLHLKKLSEELSEEVHKKILPLAIKAARKILGEELKLHPERIVEIILQALRPVVQQHQITIYVNPKDYVVVEKEQEKIQEILREVRTLKIEPREDIEEGGCTIVTESGIINAQLETQWEALEKAFASFMEKDL